VCISRGISLSNRVIVEQSILDFTSFFEKRVEPHSYYQSFPVFNNFRLISC